MTNMSNRVTRGFLGCTLSGYGQANCRPCTRKLKLSPSSVTSGNHIAIRRASCLSTIAHPNLPAPYCATTAAPSSTSRANRSRSILPPEMTMPTFLPRTSIFCRSTAVAARHPVGSTMIFIRPAKNFIVSTSSTGIADRDDVRYMFLDQGEGDLPQVLGLRAIGDGLRCFDVDDLATAKAALAVIARFRFHTEDHATGIDGTGGDCAAGQQPAAAQRRDQHIQRSNLVAQLHRRRALAGDHIGMVIRRDQRRATLLRQATTDLFAILGVAVIGDDFPTVTSGRFHLDGGGILRHHDCLLYTS